MNENEMLFTHILCAYFYERALSRSLARIIDNQANLMRALHSIKILFLINFHFAIIKHENRHFCDAPGSSDVTPFNFYCSKGIFREL